MIHDATHMTADELKEMYNVEVLEDGTVFDIVDQITYGSIQEWANTAADEGTSEYDDLIDDRYSHDGEFY